MRRVVLFVACALWSWAGSISGVAVDVTGAVIPHSKIVAISENGDRKESKSDGLGRFAVVDLKPGSYSIEISSLGFRDRTIGAVLVSGEDETRMPATELSIAVIGGCDEPVPGVGSFTPTNPRSSDLSGHVSPAGALVTVLDRAKTRKSGSVRADAHGGYTVVGLPQGKYAISVRHHGYAEQVADGIEIRKGFDSKGLDFNLTRCPHGKTCPATKWNPPLTLCL
jgi:hypothetical protein